jgi:hypothetical protein
VRSISSFRRRRSASLYESLFECYEKVLRVNIIPIYRRTVVAAAAAAVVNECSDTAVFARTHRLLWGELLPLAAALKTVADVDITKCHHRYRSR